MELLCGSLVILGVVIFLIILPTQRNPPEKDNEQ